MTKQARSRWTKFIALSLILGLVMFPGTSFGAMNVTTEITVANVAGADSAATTDLMKVAATSPVDTAGTNSHEALAINWTIGNATGGTNNVRGIALGNVTGDAQVTETGILLGTGYDIGLDAQGTPIDLDADNDTSITADTDDQIDFELGGVDHVVFKKVAVADAAATTNITAIAFTSPVDTVGTNTHVGFDVALTIGNATGGTNTATAINIPAITGDAQVTLNAIQIGALTGTAGAENALNIGGGWDSAITIGGAAASDEKILFDGNAQDYHIGLDDSADTLVVGLGSVLGTTPAFGINSSQVLTIYQDPIFGGTTPNVTVGDAGAEDAQVTFDGATQDYHVGLDDSATTLVVGLGAVLGTTPAFDVNVSQVVTFYQDPIFGGTTPNVTVGDAGAEDSQVTFDGNAQDYAIGVDDTDDTLQLTVGSVLGTTPAITVNSSRDVTLGAVLVYSVDAITSDNAGVAASVDTVLTEVTTDGDSNLDNVTLADGVRGQVKIIYLKVEGIAADTWKITPANLAGGTEITFADVNIDGEGATLVFDGTEWNITNNEGGAIT